MPASLSQSHAKVKRSILEAFLVQCMVHTFFKRTPLKLAVLGVGVGLVLVYPFHRTLSHPFHLLIVLPWYLCFPVVLMGVLGVVFSSLFLFVVIMEIYLYTKKECWHVCQHSFLSSSLCRGFPPSVCEKQKNNRKNCNDYLFHFVAIVNNRKLLFPYILVLMDSILQ